jgi:phage shock protein PspC (stress-responsive transcriptional regulator)
MVTQPPVREWTRAREGTMIGGVARGLASRFAVPVAAVRLAFVLATIFGLWGLALYVTLWIILPLEPLPLPPAWAAPPPQAAAPAPGQSA